MTVAIPDISSCFILCLHQKSETTYSFTFLMQNFKNLTLKVKRYFPLIDSLILSEFVQVFCYLSNQKYSLTQILKTLGISFHSTLMTKKNYGKEMPIFVAAAAGFFCQLTNLRARLGSTLVAQLEKIEVKHPLRPSQCWKTSL